MSEKQNEKVWFITGSSSGFGRELAEQALEKGCKVVATARKIETIEDLVEKYPQNARAIRLDVTDADETKAAIEQAIKEFGRIDVLVNNAGYGLGGGIEEPSEEQIRQQFETNVFGAIGVMRAVLPSMREQKSGHILNISSIGGFRSGPSVGYYTATKFALEALSESLAGEVEHLGIKVTIVEPGGFRTDFAGRSFVLPENRIADYVTSERLDKMSEYDGNQPGDPKKACAAMIQVVETENPPLRLPLGADAVKGMEEKIESVKQNIDEWREVAVNTAVDESNSVGK
ncbi:MAG: oxidoreductase [Acidobacteriota bacterium]